MEGNNKDTDIQEERTFTESEVNEIVQNRLARERRKTDRADSGNDREANLNDRELKIMAKEKLLDMGMSTKLADLLRYDDEESLDEAIEEYNSLIGGTGENKKEEKPKSWGQRQNGAGKRKTESEQIRAAMGLNHDK